MVLTVHKMIFSSALGFLQLPCTNKVPQNFPWTSSVRVRIPSFQVPNIAICIKQFHCMLANFTPYQFWDPISFKLSMLSTLIIRWIICINNLLDLWLSLCLLLPIWLTMVPWSASSHYGHLSLLNLFTGWEVVLCKPLGLVWSRSRKVLSCCWSQHFSYWLALYVALLAKVGFVTLFDFLHSEVHNKKARNALVATGKVIPGHNI